MRAYLNTINNPWRVFDEVMGDFPFDLFDTALRTRARRYPRVNVWESEDGLAVQAEVAGVKIPRKPIEKRKIAIEKL